MSTQKMAATNHAAGRHRLLRRRPVGKSRNKKAAAAVGMPHTQFSSQAAACQAGSDPGAATPPRSA